MKMKTRSYKLHILLLLILFAFISLTSSAEYQLHQGDQLSLTVWGHDDLSTEFSVGPDGMISLPLINSLEAEGLTLNELKEILSEDYDKYLREPRINLQLIKHRENKVLIMGEVRNPGTYQLESGKRILELISTAGGPTEMANLAQLRLTRNDEVETLDLEGLRKGSSVESNYLLEDGDVIYIPEAFIEVTIMGQVNSPGRYQLESGLKINDLIAMAGGLTNQAAFELEYSSSTDTVEYLNIEELLEGSLASPVLQEGDMVYVPEGDFRVSIMGEVRNPGTYDWNKEMRLTDLLARAGNQTEDGDIKEVRLTKRDNSRESYNLEDYFDEGDRSQNPLLEPGDSVHIDRGNFQLTVAGEVRNPGSYNWREGMRLSEVLAHAGSQTTDADISSVSISREGQERLIVDLKEYLETGDLSANPVLEAGDSVYLDKRAFEVSILGEVNQPGIYSWHSEMRLDNLLARAGNQKDRGDLSNIQIISIDGTTHLLDLEAYLDGESKEGNPLLKPGDSVIIEETDSMDWENVFSFIGGLNVLKNFLDISW